MMMLLRMMMMTIMTTTMMHEQVVAVGGGILSLLPVIAVGSRRGILSLLDLSKPADVTPIVEIHDRSDDITDLKFSPVGHLLAVASSGRDIDIYAKYETVVPNAPSDEEHAGESQVIVWERVSICVGHTASVTRIDFSEDSCYLRSNDTAGALLHWTITDGLALNTMYPDEMGKMQISSRDLSDLSRPVMSLFHG
ncbi:hypothetical protein T484DRAFT_1781099 [Baffinella frigidus]|nr:hypothetical protein T484DRAFT_1781099 [Cryptophyta sp. CCMP2293]